MRGSCHVSPIPHSTAPSLHLQQPPQDSLLPCSLQPKGTCLGAACSPQRGSLCQQETFSYPLGVCGVFTLDIQTKMLVGDCPVFVACPQQGFGEGYINCCKSRSPCSAHTNITSSVFFLFKLLHTFRMPTT